MDYQLFNSLHSLANNHWLIDLFFIFIAEWLPYIMAVAFIALIFGGYEKKERLYWLLVSAFALLIGRGIIVEVIRFFYYRPRPFKALGFEPLVNMADIASMPSGHAVFFFTLAALVFYLNKKYFWYFLVGAIFVGLGRIIVGIHWPSDILIGSAVGIASAVTAVYLLPLMKHITHNT